MSAKALEISAMLEERGARYGKFTGHALITQQLKNAMRDYIPAEAVAAPWDHKLSDDQREALEMIVHKIGRILNGDPDYADSWDDIAGYAKLVGDRLRGTAR